VSFVFVLGGARSGKSSLAVDLARRWDGPVAVLATGEAGDEEMAERIRLHRAQRPAEWTTVEEPRGVGGAPARVVEVGAVPGSYKKKQ
jgi:adenosylcobinamide kinase/adenosylcobinamide-phosphate guanylyltransferase